MEFENFYKGMCNCITAKGTICSRAGKLEYGGYCFQHKNCKTPSFKGNSPTRKIKPKPLPKRPIKIVKPKTPVTSINFKIIPYQKGGIKNSLFDEQEEKLNSYFINCFGEPAKGEVSNLRSYMKATKSSMVIFYHDYDIIGFAALEKYKNFLLIHVICIGKEHQGKGYCKLALKPFVSQMKEKILLSVLKINIAAIKCYENVGFTPINLTKKELTILEGWNPLDSNYMWMKYKL